MAGLIELARLGPDDWPLWRRLRLEALAEAPHAFSSKLSDWTGRGDHESRWRSRLGTVALNLACYLDRTEAGMASATAPADGEVELISMWVAPFARGRGVGDTGCIAATASWTTE
jgi:ribosomal protein S18 acetylase RimI-like enzyme